MRHAYREYLCQNKKNIENCDIGRKRSDKKMFWINDRISMKTGK